MTHCVFSWTAFCGQLCYNDKCKQLGLTPKTTWLERLNSETSKYCYLTEIAEPNPAFPRPISLKLKSLGAERQTKVQYVPKHHYINCLVMFSIIELESATFSIKFDCLAKVLWRLYIPVMCESESGFESRFKAFWAGFGFEPKKPESEHCSALRNFVKSSGKLRTPWTHDSQQECQLRQQL